MINTDEILRMCLNRLDGTVLVSAWGEDGLFYNPGGVLKRGVYVMTVKKKDGDNDKGSLLNRDGVYRINTGISKNSFRKLFGTIPTRPAAGNIVDLPYDFSELNKIIPHPVYAWMGWICVLNPTEETFQEFLKYIDEAYELAKKKFEKRVKA